MAAITIRNVRLDLSFILSIIQFEPWHRFASTCEESSHFIARLVKIYNYHFSTLTRPTCMESFMKLFVTFEGENMFKFSPPTRWWFDERQWENLFTCNKIAWTAEGKVRKTTPWRICYKLEFCRNFLKLELENWKYHLDRKFSKHVLA